MRLPYCSRVGVVDHVVAGQEAEQDHVALVAVMSNPRRRSPGQLLFDSVLLLAQLSQALEHLEPGNQAREIDPIRD